MIDPNAKDRVLADRRLRLDIGEAVPVKPREASVSDHGDGQSGARPAVQHLSHRQLQIEIIDPTGLRRVLTFVGPGDGSSSLLLSCLTERTLGYLGSIGVMVPSRPSMAAAASRHMSSRYRGPIICTAWEDRPGRRPGAPRPVARVC